MAGRVNVALQASILALRDEGRLFEHVQRFGRRTHRNGVVAAVMALALAGVAAVGQGGAAGGSRAAARTAGSGAEAESFTSGRMPLGLAPVAAAALAPPDYHFSPAEGGWQAPNPAQGISARFFSDGLRVTHDAGVGTLGLTLARVGRGTDLQSPAPARLEAHGARLEYRRGSLTEWYVNDPRGVEQGFTLDAAPSGDRRRPVVVELTASGGLRPALDPGGRSIRFQGQGATLHYGNLHAWDAAGRPLPSHLSLTGTRVSLSVDDAGAAYPLTIDPILATQQAKLTAADAADFDQFGRSVAVSGDTVVVGAPVNDLGGSDLNDAGSAYVFVRSGSTWSQQAKLTAADADAADEFGSSVAVSGDTAVVGATTDGHGTPNLNDAGSAYVFVRSGSTWSQQAKLTAADAGDGDRFGSSLAVLGDIAMVGAPSDDHGSPELANAGSVHVFTRTGTAWAPQAKLTAADAAQADQFGASVAMSGDTAVVGASSDDHGNPTISNAGSAYVFVRSGDTWSEEAKLTAADAGASDQFGASAAVSGDTALVGAPADDHGSPSLSNAGSAYVFVRSGTAWSEQAKLTAADATAGDRFGSAVAVAGNKAVVGAQAAVRESPPMGSAYVFMRSETAWTPEAKLTADDAAENDLFGTSVALSGGTLVVGAPFDNHGSPVLADAGSAYVFTLPMAVAEATIATQATSTATLGSAISDTATVTGAPAAAVPTGTVTFTLFGPGNPTCTGAPIFTSGTQPLAGGPPPTANSGLFTPSTPGSYNWVAVYSGDANYASVTSPCGAPNETSTVGKASPTISTQASAGGILGVPVTDTATVTGGLSPTGTVTFRLFSDNTCATQVFTSSSALAGGMATSAGFTPGAAGTYYWTAAYSGDASNNPATAPCNAPNESVVITPFQAPTYTSTIAGDLSGPVTVSSGQSVLIAGARVTGPVSVEPGGALTIVNSAITRGITANAPSFFSICGTDVSGPPPATALSVTNAPVPIRVGDPATGCAGNRFAGQVVLSNNLAVTLGANTVSHTATIVNNGPGNTVIKANTLFGTLTCSGNSPSPTNAGQVNSAPSKTGQCVSI